MSFLTNTGKPFKKAASYPNNIELIPAFYKKLIHAFGPQGWWPTTPLKGVHPIYWTRKGRRRLTDQDQFEICLGALLTQNTSWSNVEKALRLLKEKRALDFKQILRLRRSRLQKYIRSSGYFRQKSIRVRNFLKIVQKEIKGGPFARFFRGPTTDLRQKLLAIKGIGPETADSMLLYAAGRPVFVVDAYTRRIGTRWNLLKGNETYDEIQKIFMSSLPRSARVYNEYHALLVKLAKENCLKKTVCRTCPVNTLCATGQQNQRRHS